MKQNTKTILIIIVIALVGYFVFFKGKIPFIGAIGNPNYPTSCSFITNVNPYTSRYTLYDGTSVWIAIDYNGDGIKEKFGRVSSSTGVTGSIGTKLIDNYNTYGDDIYTRTGSSGDVYIRVASPSSPYSFVELKKDYSAAVNAVTTCGTSCTDTCTSKGYTCGTWTICGSSVNCGTCASGYSCSSSGTCVAGCIDECTSSGTKMCSVTATTVGYKTCGNYDSDSCLEYSSVTNCATGQTCVNGVCQTSTTCSYPTPNNCDTKAEFDIVYNEWKQTICSNEIFPLCVDTFKSTCGTCPSCNSCCSTCPTYTCASLGCTGSSCRIEADTSGDSKINWNELAIIAERWVTQT